MARIRTIKPEFCTSAQVAECSKNARLLFVLMWMHCDDNGVHPASAKQLRMECFPGDDDMTAPVVQGLVDELLAQSLLMEYENGGQRYWHVTGWKHQRIDKPQPGKYPTPASPDSYLIPADGAEHSRNHSGSIPRTLPPEGKGKEGKGEEGIRREGKGSVATSAAPPRPGVERSPNGERQPSKTEPVWTAYADEYRRVYQADPVRNAKVNGQLANIVDRIGAAEAPEVAAWFVHHRKRWYVEKGHSVECLQKDCEQLRTEWATGRRSTSTAALQADRTQQTGDVAAKLIAEAEAGNAA